MNRRMVAQYTAWIVQELGEEQINEDKLRKHVRWLHEEVFK